MCNIDCHDMTLAVKVAFNPNTFNQPIMSPYIDTTLAVKSQYIPTNHVPPISIDWGHIVFLSSVYLSIYLSKI